MAQKELFFKQIRNLALALGTLVLLIACGDKKQTDEDLQQAFELHEKAVKIREKMDDQIALLKANTDATFVEVHKKDLDSISSLLKAWDNQLVEVPGFGHEHDHSGHDHDHHHHNDQQKLTPKQHLEVQQHLLEEIKAIAKKIEILKK